MKVDETLLRRCFVALFFNIHWVLCPSVAHNPILQPSLLHVLTSWYTSLARLHILIILCPQSPFPNPCLIFDFISISLCQELQFCSSLQCLLHLFIVLIFISVTSLYQQSLHPETVTTFCSDYCYTSLASAFRNKQGLVKPTTLASKSAEDQGEKVT